MANVLPRIIELKRTALDLLFPRWCLGCGREGAFICPECRRSLPRIRGPVCPRCGNPSIDGALCSDCLQRDGAIDGILSPFAFDGLIRRAVHEMKYRNLRALATTLAGLMHEFLSANPVPADVIVPVPLHRRRLRERGYNQAGLLARELGRLAGLPVLERSLWRCRMSLPQVRTEGVEARRRNVADAFTVRGEELAGKRVLLIDDVTTSGATLEAGGAAVKAAGAVSVRGLTVAREI